MHCCLEIYLSKLPHRTGAEIEALSQDDVLRITRATLVDLSRTSASSVLDPLVLLLEDLAASYGDITSH